AGLGQVQDGQPYMGQGQPDAMVRPQAVAIRTTMAYAAAAIGQHLLFVLQWPPDSGYSTHIDISRLYELYRARLSAPRLAHIVEKLMPQAQYVPRRKPFAGLDGARGQRLPGSVIAHQPRQRR